MEENFKLNLREILHISVITLDAQRSAKGSPQLLVPLKSRNLDKASENMACRGTSPNQVLRTKDCV